MKFREISREVTEGLEKETKEVVTLPEDEDLISSEASEELSNNDMKERFKKNESDKEKI